MEKIEALWKMEEGIKLIAQSEQIVQHLLGSLIYFNNGHILQHC